MMKVVPTRVGDAFQAEIPAMLSQEERATRSERPPPRAQWTPAQSVLSDSEIDEYLSCTRLNESEAALRCLHEANLDVHKAAQLLHKERQRRCRASRARSAAINEDEFAAALLAHGKKFFAIRQQYPAAQPGDLVARFYLWKTTTAYKRWRERAKAKKNKEAARLRQWADAAEGASELSDFHNEYCELCVTGGQLLCCDGCERAYHFSCVEPPIKDVPMGDWFCARCAAILGTEAEERASPENPLCREVTLRVSPTTLLASQQSARSGHDDEISEPDDEEEEERSVFTDGNDTDEIEDTTMDDNDGKVKVEAVVVKQEPVEDHTPHPRLYTPERPRPQLLQAKRPVTLDAESYRTPSKSPLLLESTNRKRQRKIVAPRRIPQANTPPSAPP